VSRIRFQADEWKESSFIKVNIDETNLALTIKLTNIDHNGHLCMHYKGDKENV